MNTRKLLKGIATAALGAVLAPLLVLSVAPLAHGAGAHTHGEATLLVAVDGPIVTLDFDSPLDNLAGFEHAPRTEKQKQALADMALRLREPARLFAPDPAAGCEFVSVKLTPPATGQPAASGPKGARKDDGEHQQHKDYEAQYIFRCSSANKLRFIDVTLFDAFPRIKRIKASVAGVARQSAMTLTPSKRRLSW